MPDQRTCLSFVHFQAIGDDFLLVIGPLIEFRTVTRAGRDARRQRVNIVDRAAARTTASSCQTFDQGLPANVEQQHRLQGLTYFLQQRAQRPSLIDIAWEAIENETVRGIGAAETIPDQPQDDVVGNELPGIHRRLRLQTQLRSSRYGVAQQVSGRDLRYTIFRLQTLRLCSLARPRGSQQYDAHHSTGPPEKRRYPTEKRRAWVLGNLGFRAPGQRSAALSLAGCPRPPR